MFAVPVIADAERAAAVSGLPVVVKSEVDVLSARARSIAFRDVRFTYPRSNRPVLDGMDLEIPAGQRLAIVGLNGSGKTTLIKVLCRLYDPSAGTVLIDGVDLRDLDPGAWRAGRVARRS
jgi:ABC-type multidrug transport system fused ATPase/permease subunit